MQQIILIFHAIVCTLLIGLVLLQHGKGADVGASFGSGASNTVFGSQGSGSFLTRVTGILAGLFFALSLALSYLAMQDSEKAKLQALPSLKTTITAPQTTKTTTPATGEEPASSVPDLPE